MTTSHADNQNPFIAYFKARFQGHTAETALAAAGWIPEKSNDAHDNEAGPCGTMLKSVTAEIADQDCSLINIHEASPRQVLQDGLKSLVQIENDQRCIELRRNLASSMIETIIDQLDAIEAADALAGHHVSNAIASVVGEAAVLQVSTISDMLHYEEHGY